MSAQNILDQMTAGVMEKKAAKTTKLTPVGTEAGVPEKAILDRSFNTSLPYDQADQVQKALADARAQAVFVLAGIDAMIASFGPNPYQSAAPDTAALAQKAAEKSADERIAASTYPDYAQLQKEAQAAVFTSVAEESDPLPEIDSEAHKGWKCPAHGYDSVTSLTSKKGRSYKACTKCEEFER